MRRSLLVGANDPYLNQRLGPDEDDWGYAPDMDKEPCADLEKNILGRWQRHSAPLIVDQSARTVWLFKAADLCFDGASSDSDGDLNVMIDLSTLIAYSPGREWHRPFEGHARVYRQISLVLDLEDLPFPRRIHFWRELRDNQGLAHRLNQLRSEILEQYMPLLGSHPHTSFQEPGTKRA